MPMVVFSEQDTFSAILVECQTIIANKYITHPIPFFHLHADAVALHFYIFLKIVDSATFNKHNSNKK